MSKFKTRLTATCTARRRNSCFGLRAGYEEFDITRTVWRGTHEDFQTVRGGRRWLRIVRRSRTVKCRTGS